MQYQVRVLLHLQLVPRQRTKYCITLLCTPVRSTKHRVDPARNGPILEESCFVSLFHEIYCYMEYSL